MVVWAGLESQVRKKTNTLFGCVFHLKCAKSLVKAEEDWSWSVLQDLLPHAFAETPENLQKEAISTEEICLDKVYLGERVPEVFRWVGEV